MQLAGAARLFLANTLWRTTGWRREGRALMRALGSEDEDLRTLAATFLTKAGPRAEPLLEEALQNRENLPLVLTIGADIGAERFEPFFRRFRSDADPDVARAAESALRLLAAQRHEQT